MSPLRIVAEAREKKIDIIGITDHNSTLHCKLIRKLAAQAGISVLSGAEVGTREEVHCLAFFEEDETLDAFQAFLDKHIPRVPNDVHRFGDQVVLDENENIIAEEPWLLLNGLSAGIKQIEEKVHDLNGIFIPAHIDRPYYSLFSQLGFFPDNLKVEALEISRKTDPSDFLKRNNMPEGISLLKNSDAHYPGDIGRAYNLMWLESPTFNEVKLALAGEQGRYVRIQ
jgi:hypothetical protein